MVRSARVGRSFPPADRRTGWIASVVTPEGTALREQGVEQLPAAVKGTERGPERLHLDESQFHEDARGG